MILHLQANVYVLGYFRVSTSIYPIFSKFKTTFCPPPFLPSRLARRLIATLAECPGKTNTRSVTSLLSCWLAVWIRFACLACRLACFAWLAWCAWHAWVAWLACCLEILLNLLDLLGLLNLQGNLFRTVGEKILKEISLENVKVEHDFSGGLSKRVTLKFFWQPPNLTRIGNPYDFAIAS